MSPIAESVTAEFEYWDQHINKELPHLNLEQLAQERILRWTPCQGTPPPLTLYHLPTCPPLVTSLRWAPYSSPAHRLPCSPPRMRRHSASESASGSIFGCFTHPQWFPSVLPLSSCSFGTNFLVLLQCKNFIKGTS